MKRKLMIGMALTILVALFMTSCKKDETNNNGTSEGYVNLGLPSGTLWKSANESSSGTEFFNFDGASSKFGSHLPTKEQWQELLAHCTWTLQNNGSYMVKGSNGNSIVLPAAGYRIEHDGENQIVGVGRIGTYWSSTPYDSYYAWGLFFDGDDELTMSSNCPRNLELPVRLIQK